MILFNIALILHIAGIVLIAGTTFTNYYIAKQFWSFIDIDKPKAVIINSTALLFARMTAVGGIVTILSGIIMVAALHSAFVMQTWFQIKMVLVLFIILISALIEAPQNKKLQKLLPNNNGSMHLNSIKQKMNLYYAVQFILLITVFILSVFRFN